MIGSGIYFDGLTNARQPVAVALGADALEITAPAGELLATWRFAEIAPLATPAGILRIGQIKSKVAARLEIRDEAFASVLLARTKAFDRSGLTDRRTRVKVVLWSVVAIASFLSCGIWGVPLVADRVAPHLPTPVEQHLGAAIDVQVRRILNSGTGDRSLECGTGPEQQAARDAVDKLVGTLETAADLPLPLRVTVVRRSEVNAITLPGGRIYLYEGLLKQAKSADEVAGVLGHEIGHVAHRDVTKALLRKGSMSILFGMLLGDFTGGGALVFSADLILTSSNSREAEAAADDFGARLVSKAGGDPQALGNILQRISANVEGKIPHFLLDHPESAERAGAIARISPPAAMKPLLSPQEWAALKNICA